MQLKAHKRIGTRRALNAWMLQLNIVIETADGTNDIYILNLFWTRRNLSQAMPTHKIKATDIRI